MAQAISNLPIGARVKIPVNGVDTAFIVVNQGTPDGSSSYVNCNGTWVMAEKVYGSGRSWGTTSSSSSAYFYNSSIKTYLNGTFYNMLDTAVQASILSAKLPGRGGYKKSYTGSAATATPVFLLGTYEVCITEVYAGATLAYFKGWEYNESNAAAVRVATDTSGTARPWWLRDAWCEDWDDEDTGESGTDYLAYRVSTTGAWSSASFGNVSTYVRPCFILNFAFEVSDTMDDDRCYTIGGGGSSGSAKFYTGDASAKAQAVKKLYVGDANGVAQKIKKLYVGVPNFTKQSLPSGYTQVEYIQSSGTQYIDTGFKPNNNTRVVLEAYNLSASSGWTFGVWTNSTTQQYAFSCNTSYTFRYGTSNVSLPTVPVGKFVVDFNKNSYKLNDTSGTFAAQTFTSPYPIYLFAICAAGSVSSGRFTGRISSCQIYDNGTMVRDYVPCKNASGTVGLYDLVNGSFYTNAGTGTFTAGDTYKSVARLIYSAHEPNTLSYYGTVTSLKYAKNRHTGASNPKYALFAGAGATVDAYSSSLVRTTPTSLTNSRNEVGAASIGDYAIFAGGTVTNNPTSSNVDAYNSSLTRTQKTLSKSRGYSRGASVGNYAIFSAGYYDNNGDNYGAVNNTDAFNTSLTRTTLSGAQARWEHGGASNGSYAIFGGGRADGYIYSNVWYWNASLTCSTTSLLVSVSRTTGVRAGNYALFIAGDDADNLTNTYDDNIVNVFNTSMTRSNVFLRAGSESGYSGATTLGQYGIVWSGNRSLHAFDDKLTYLSKDMSSISDVSGIAAATIGEYALFSGGYGYAYTDEETGDDVYEAKETVHAFKLI